MPQPGRAPGLTAAGPKSGSAAPGRISAGVLALQGGPKLIFDTDHTPSFSCQEVAAKVRLPLPWEIRPVLVRLPPWLPRFP